MIRGSRPGKPDRNGLPELATPYKYRGRKSGLTIEETLADQAARRWAEDVASGRLKPPAAHRKVSRETGRNA